MFSSFNYALKLFPIFISVWRLIFFKVSVAVSVPLTLGMFGNIDNLWVLGLYSFHGISKRLNSMFKGFAISDTICIDCFDGFD